MKQLAIALTLLLFTLPGSAGAEDDTDPAGITCIFERCYGAVGTGENGAFAFAYGQMSATIAEKLVQRDCQGNCGVIQSFYNACGAIAVAENKGWGWSSGATRDIAEKWALRYCREQGENCRVVVWSCSF